MFYENQSSGTNAEIAATVTGFGGAVGQFAKGAKAGVTALGIFGAEEAFEQKTGLPSFNPVSLVRNFKSGAGFAGSVTNAIKSLFGAPSGTRIRDLNPLGTPAHTAPRPHIQSLTDDELLRAARNPADGNGLVRNTRTGKLHDGNGRALELQRRAADPNSKISPNDRVPVEDFTSDRSMFIDP